VEWVTSIKGGLGVLSIDYIDALFGHLFNQTVSTSVIIIIIMFMKGKACFRFLNPQDEVGPSISSSVVCSFILLVHIVLLVLKKKEEQRLEAAQMKF
jgi:hypothetical protein